MSFPCRSRPSCSLVGSENPFLTFGPYQHHTLHHLTYMHGPLYLLLATPHPSSPHDTHGRSGPPHTTYCLAGLSGLHALWCTIRVRCPNQEVGTTQGSLARTLQGATHEWHMVQSDILTQQYIQGTCRRMWHIIRARCSNWRWGATQVSPDSVVAQTIGGSTQGNIYRTTCISKRNLLTSLLYLQSCLWSFMKPIFG